MPKSGSSSAKESASRMKSAQGRSSGGSSTADGSFVPTVTAVATAPDLKWMVLSTDISSVRSCRQRKAAQGPQGKQTRSSSSSSNSSSSSSHRAPGARRKAPKEELSPEEEERRRVRRERNKLAAAKCRNRRRELTDSLQAETDNLEEEKAALQAEISSLLKEKEQLELLLADHQPHCKIPPQVEEEEDEEADEEKEEKEEEEGICKAHSQNPSTVLPVPEEGEEKEQQTDVRESPPCSPVHLDKMPSSPLALHQVTTCPPELDAPLCPIISGDSDVLLCSSATLEPYIDLKDVPMEQEDEDDDDDVDLLVPDIDLTASLGLSEWETLYMTMGGSLDPLSPTCCCGGDDDDGVPTAFDFPCMDGEAKTGSDNSKLLVS